MKIKTSTHKNSGNSVLFIASFANCPRVWKMATALEKRKFRVTLLEWDRDSSETNYYPERLCVKRLKLPAPYGIRAFFRLPIWSMFVFLCALFYDYDVIQPQNLDNLFFSWLPSKLRKKKVVYDIADFYADGYIPDKIRFLRSGVSVIERILARMVDHVIIVDEERSCQLPSIISSTVIYNSPPDTFLELKQKHNQENIFVIFYAGILSEDRGLNFIIQAVSLLSSARLIIAGFGPRELSIRNLVRKEAKIDFLGKIQYDEVLKLTSLSNCIIALYDPSVPINALASPNKLFEAMMCEKPIIVNQGTTMAKKVLAIGCGIVVEYGNVKSLTAAIDFLEKDPTACKSMGQRGRDAYCTLYGWPIMVNRLLHIYDYLLK